MQFSHGHVTSKEKTEPFCLLRLAPNQCGTCLQYVSSMTTGTICLASDTFHSTSTIKNFLSNQNLLKINELAIISMKCSN
jgi:hypothetical protein